MISTQTKKKMLFKSYSFCHFKRKNFYTGFLKQVKGNIRSDINQPNITMPLFVVYML
jgi:hypothetical protein